MKKDKLHCPGGHGEMKLAYRKKTAQFRGVKISFPEEYFACPVCKLEAGNLRTAGNTQRSMADTYREKAGLMTAKQIVKYRKKQGITQAQLAERMNVGIASIKRWEGATIQTRSMDRMMRMAFEGVSCGDPCTGNREFSLSRIKLVLMEIESALRRQVLKKGDRFLYAAKYLWFVDMLAYRETGQSVTGAAYAALPKGPQLNNYKDLVDKIIEAKEKQAEPLTTEEKRIVRRVAMTFPENGQIYKAAHQEDIWKEKTTGAMIPYTDASRLTQI
jgi:putative zinc finger/helix-turn-helix YgiT family protein